MEYRRGGLVGKLDESGRWGELEGYVNARLGILFFFHVFLSGVLVDIGPCVSVGVLYKRTTIPPHPSMTFFSFLFVPSSLFSSDLCVFLNLIWL